MFEPRTDRIRELPEIYPERIKELETIFSGRTNVYIDFANVIGWQDKLGLNELRGAGLRIFDIQKIRDFICWPREMKATKSKKDSIS